MINKVLLTFPSASVICSVGSRITQSNKNPMTALQSLPKRQLLTNGVKSKNVKSACSKVILDSPKISSLQGLRPLVIPFDQQSILLIRHVFSAFRAVDKGSIISPFSALTSLLNKTRSQATRFTNPLRL